MNIEKTKCVYILHTTHTHTYSLLESKLQMSI